MTKRTRRSGVAFLAMVMMLSIALESPAVSADPSKLGQWSVPFWEGGSKPYEPASLETSKAHPAAVTSVVLPDGRILYWNGIEGSENADAVFFDENLKWTLENSRSRILDLRSGKPEWTIPNPERGTSNAAQGPSGSTHDLFCADQKLLYDGTLLIAGGMEARHPEMAADAIHGDVHGDNEARIFDPNTDTFISVPAMRERRWYPAMVTLADGRVLVTSGVRQLARSAQNPEPSFSQVRLSEIYHPEKKEWLEGGINDFSLPLFPRLHLLPNGNVFYGGAAQSWTPLGSTADQATWGLQRLYDPATKQWSSPGHSLYGVRNGATSTLLRLEPPFDTSQILIAGGTAGVAPTTYAGTTLSEVVSWSANGGIDNEAIPKNPLAGLAGDPTQLRNVRWYGSTLILPTGELVTVNGGDVDDLVEPGSAGAVRMAELYDPISGTWKELAPGRRDRVYHNTAVLLPDGSVLVGGNSPAPAHYLRHDSPATRSNNYKDSTFEIYKPPYLFRGPRPEVSSVTTVNGGRALRLKIEESGPGRGQAAGSISEVVLVRLTAATHSVDADTRAVKLEHSVAGPNVFAQLPHGGDGNILPPGPYYVFALRNTPDGPVPSIAHTILVQPEEEGKVIATIL